MIRGKGNDTLADPVSRKARPEKGPVRQPHLDQHACLSQRENANELGRIAQINEGRSSYQGSGTTRALTWNVRLQDPSSWPDNRPHF